MTTGDTNRSNEAVNEHGVGAGSTAQGSPVVPRGAVSRRWWWGLWASVVLLFALQAVDAVQRAAPAVVWMLWYLPLLVVLPGVLRDRQRSVIWLSFVTLLYFVGAVMRLFAEPASALAQGQLLAVIGLFLCSMFYLRLRGRELRTVIDEEA